MDSEPLDLAVESEQQQLGTLSRRRKTSFAGDVFKLVSGTTVAQALSILVAPLLTRLYAPEAFGLLAVFTSLTGFAGALGCLRYEMAIVLPARDEEAANLLALSLGLGLVIALASAPLLWVVGGPLLRLLKAPELGPYLWLVPVVVLLSGMFLALNAWNSRTKHFGRLSLVRVIGAASTHAAKLGAGYAGYTTGGALVGATVLGSALSTLILGYKIWREDATLFWRSVKRSEILLALRRYAKFPLYSTWASALSIVALNLPSFLLSYFFSPTEVGYYSLGYRLIQTPMVLIGGAMAQVFLQRAAEAKVEGKLAPVVENVLRTLLLLGWFPLLLLTILGQELFAIAFGRPWAEAGLYTQILALSFLMSFIGSPISNLVNVLEKQEAGLYFHLFQVLSRLVALGIGGKLGNIRLALVLLSASGALGWLGFCLYLAKAAGASWHNVRGAAAQALLWGVPILAGLALAQTIGKPRPLVLILLACAGTALYYGLIISHNRPLRAVLSALWREHGIPKNGQEGGPLDHAL